MTATVVRFYTPKQGREPDLPLFEFAVPEGYPSPVDGKTPTKLNLVKHLIKHPDETYYATVDGDSMEDAGIFSGDLLVIDCSCQPTDGAVVVTLIDGEYAVVRFSLGPARLFLASDNPRPLSDVWGVVTHVIHTV